MLTLTLTVGLGATLAANTVAKPAWAPTLAANTVAKPAWAPTLAANTVAKPTWGLKGFVTKIYGKLNGVESLCITRFVVTKTTPAQKLFLEVLI